MLGATRVAVIEADEFKRDDLVEALAKTHPGLTTIAFASASDCVSSSADPGVILLCFGQGTGSKMALDHIEQLRCAFPGVPVMALNRG
jgi:ribose 5-phosphate isomerase RpiB